MTIKLAEALLRRKELQEKVDQLRKINEKELYEVKTGRKQAHEGIDDIIAQIPKISLNQVTAGFDYYAKQLRLIDAAIQQANWTTNIDVDNDTLKDFVDPYIENK